MSTIFPKLAIAGASLTTFGLLWAGFNGIDPAEQGQFISQAHAAEKATIIPAPRVNASEKGKRAVADIRRRLFLGRRRRV